MPFELARRALPADAEREIETATRTFARVWGRRPLVDGRSFRELLEWKGASLWWMVETHFRTSTEAVACARQAEILLRVLEAEAPQEVEGVGLPNRDAVLLERAATARGVLCHTHERARTPARPGWSSWLKGAFSHRARSGKPLPSAEYLLVTDAKEELPTESPVPVPLEALHDADSREARTAMKTARPRFDEAFAELAASAGVREAFSHRGVAFHDLCAHDLEELLQVALPRAVHLFEETAALLHAASPRAVAVRVASRDERRTVLAACRSAGVPTVFLRTQGEHEPERLDGGPEPDLVLAWDGSAGPDDLREALHEAAVSRVGTS